MKKLLSIILSVVVLFCSLSLVVFADDTRDNTKDTLLYKERVELFLDSIGHPSTVSNPMWLKNVFGEDEAIVFTLGNSGYIIININDLSIPELSLVNQNPYLGYDAPVYNGPIEYYYIENGQIRSIIDDSVLDVNRIIAPYHQTRINNKDEFVSDLRSATKEHNRNLDVEKYLPYSLQTWYVSGGHCGAIASAICMRYYYDHVNTSYVGPSYTSESALISVMQFYVGSGGTSYSNMVSGLNSYFASRYVTNAANATTPFSFSKVRNAINANRPIIVGTYNHPVYGSHWLIAHGFFQSDLDGNYVIVNNGCGYNNVWVAVNTTYLDGTIHFTN